MPQKTQLKTNPLVGAANLELGEDDVAAIEGTA
jgi:hypothetical protein